MKEFTTAVEQVVAEDERETKILALIEGGKTREEAEQSLGPEDFVEFKVDGRVMRAYMPTDGQLTFLLAAVGRGQSKESRFAAILNIMFESLREDDKDYLEGRLLSRDPAKRIPMSTVEGIFEHITEEWFARPTKQPSGSADSPQTDGQN